LAKEAIEARKLVSALIRLSREAMGEVFRDHLPPSGSGGLAEAAGEG
jgi:hypothetical protein